MTIKEIVTSAHAGASPAEKAQAEAEGKTLPSNATLIPVPLWNRIIRRSNDKEKEVFLKFTKMAKIRKK